MTENKNPQTTEYVPSRDGWWNQFLPWWDRPVDDVTARDENVYVNMRDDGQVAACLQMLLGAVTTKDPEFVPCVDEDSPEYAEAERQAKYVEAVFHNFDRQTIRDVIGGMLAACADGYSAGEIIWQPNEKDFRLPEFPTVGLWRIAKIKSRDPRVLKPVTDQYDNITGYKAKVAAMDIDVPAEKILHFTARELFCNPLGRSYFRGAVKWWRLKAEIAKQYAAFLANYAGGIITVAVPSTYSAEEIQTAVNRVSKARAGNVLAYPASASEKTGIDVHTWSSTGDAFESALDSCDKQIAKAIILGWIALEGNTTGNGTYGTSTVSFDVFMGLVQYLRSRVEDALNEGPIEQLCKYNFTNPLPPRINLGSVDEKDLLRQAQIWEAVKRLLDEKPFSFEQVAEAFDLPADLIDEEAQAEYEQAQDANTALALQRELELENNDAGEDEDD